MTLVDGDETDRGALRPTLDRWLQAGIVRRGLVQKCPLCRYTAWYPLDQVTQGVRCVRCSQDNVVMVEPWRKEESEPAIYYDLAEIVYQAVDNDAEVPILSLARLKEGSRSFLYTTERDIFDSEGNRVCEVDFFVVRDGEVVIGEAKRGNQLSDKGTSDAELKADQLAVLAAAIGADRFVLATSSPDFHAGTVSYLRVKLGEVGCALDVLTNLTSSSSS